MDDDPTSENGEQDPETVYVTFSGANRIASTGIPVDVKGWWEIRGLSFEAGMEVAYALAADRHMTVARKPYAPQHKLTSGCTYLVVAGPPKQARARAQAIDGADV